MAKKEQKGFKVKYTDGQVATYVAMACMAILEMNELSLSQDKLIKIREDHLKGLINNNMMSKAITTYVTLVKDGEPKPETKIIKLGE